MIVWLLVYCPVDNTLFEVNPEIHVCQMTSVVMETIHLILSQFKQFLSHLIDNLIPFLSLVDFVYW